MDNRKTSIELLKIVAIFSIVICHVSNTLVMGSNSVNYSDYMVDLVNASRDFQKLTVAILSYLGTFGNTVFFICSAWFFLDDDKVSLKKWFRMFTEIWIVSVIILIISYIIRDGDISGLIVIRSLFPNIFCNNWYLTAYLVFYPLHGLLNKLIEQMNQKMLFRIAMSLILIFVIINFFMTSFFATELTLWFSIYFFMAYIKRYCYRFTTNIKANCLVAAISLGVFIGIIVLTNFLGLYIPIFANKVLYWRNNCNPFMILFCITLFNIALNLDVRKKRGKCIQQIASLSMLVYLIHENIIVREYYRPCIWEYIYKNYGYSYLLLWVVGLAVTIFVLSTIVAYVYKHSIGILVYWISDKLLENLKKMYLTIEEKMLMLSNKLD